MNTNNRSHEKAMLQCGPQLSRRPEYVLEIINIEQACAPTTRLTATAFSETPEDNSSCCTNSSPPPQNYRTVRCHFGYMRNWRPVKGHGPTGGVFAVASRGQPRPVAGERRGARRLAGSSTCGQCRARLGPSGRREPWGPCNPTKPTRRKGGCQSRTRGVKQI